jgi:hypothetical protein
MSSDNGTSEKPAPRPLSPLAELNRLIHEQLEKEIEPILRKAVQLAKEGNVGALRLLLKYVGVARPGRPVRCELPALRTPEDVVASVQILAADLAAGRLTPAEAAHITKMLDEWLQANAYVRLEKRIKAVEEMAGTARRLPDWPPRDQ